VLDGDQKRYEEWERARDAAREQGTRPSLVVQTVTEVARRRAEEDELEAEVTVVDATSSLPRPAGPRFGTLVHAVLATVALDATRDAVEAVASLQSRILGATDEETAAAATLVASALSHPLLARAREAWRAGACRRESPITSVEADGSILEGVLDLAFEDDAGWTVVDFKTAGELGGALVRYRRQVAMYASVVSRVTGRPATPVLMRL
jgi:ATP-dependent helicase/nuclease subunit A